MNQSQYNQLFSFIWNIATDVLVYAFEKGDYKKIILPMMAPSITINVLTTSIAAFKMYELPWIISKGLPGYSTRLLTQRIHFFGFESSKFGLGSALSVILILVITVISLVMRWIA